MDGKKRFWCLLGLWPKGTAARHPCVSCGKLLRRIRAHRYVCRLAGGSLLPDARQATYFCRQTKVCKNCFFRLPSRGKRNCPPAISTPRLGVSQNPPAGRPRALAPDRRAIFMGHSVRILSTEDRPADAGMLSVNWQRPPKAGGRKAQDCGRVRACSLAPKAQPVAPGEERVIHSSRPPEVT